ncbi:histidine phosphatase family protein [Enterococcus faecalis]|uniref:histidine phosphatase family protein n=1 Tax=Enterococcus faecalis TaxID=1351 RepID=UPI003DA10869
MAAFRKHSMVWLDVSLTEKGQEQARKAGEKIKNAQIEFDAAFTSVLKRASRTCQIILCREHQSSDKDNSYLTSERAALWRFSREK